MNYWNELVKVRDNFKDSNPDVAKMAEMLLGQLNTAGAKHLIGHEIEAFLTEISLVV